MAQHGHLTRKEKKIIRQKRRELRRDLRKRGIYSRAEFETIAQQMGLVYGARGGWLKPWWWLLDTFGINALIGALLALIALLSILFAYAYLNKQKEDFTVALSGNLLRVGFDLSETEDFKNPQVHLNADILKECNACSVADLPEKLDDAEGAHNGSNYMAYTFWIRNHGEETVDYEWQVTLVNATANLADAVWIMIFDEGKQVIYAKAPEGHEQEKLSGYKEWPLYNEAADPEAQYYNGSRGKGIATTAYVDESIVTEGRVEAFKPEDKHKYTVVMWVEGDDPECTNENLGGKALFNFKFAVARNKDGEVFDDFIFSKEDYYRDNTESSSSSADSE